MRGRPRSCSGLRTATPGGFLVGPGVGRPLAYTLERATPYTAQIIVSGNTRWVARLTRPFIARASSTRP